MPAGSVENDYVLPLVHTRVPAPVVEIGFWTALAGGALIGLLDPPLAAVVGAAVLLGRHRHA